MQAGRMVDGWHWLAPSYDMTLSVTPVWIKLNPGPWPALRALLRAHRALVQLAVVPCLAVR